MYKRNQDAHYDNNHIRLALIARDIRKRIPVGIPATKRQSQIYLARQYYQCRSFIPLCVNHPAGG